MSLQSMVQHTVIGGMETSGVMAWCFPGSGTKFNPPVGSFRSSAIAEWLVQLWLYHFFLSRNCLIGMASSNHMVIFCTCTLYCTEIIYSASLTLQCPMHTCMAAKLVRSAQSWMFYFMRLRCLPKHTYECVEAEWRTTPRGSPWMARPRSTCFHWAWVCSLSFSTSITITFIHNHHLVN